MRTHVTLEIVTPREAFACRLGELALLVRAPKLGSGIRQRCMQVPAMPFEVFLVLECLSFALCFVTSEGRVMTPSVVTVAGQIRKQEGSSSLPKQVTSWKGPKALGTEKRRGVQIGS